MHDKLSNLSLSYEILFHINSFCSYGILVQFVGFCKAVGWDCLVSRRGQASGRKVGGWLGGKREARCVGICTVVGWDSGAPC